MAKGGAALSGQVRNSLSEMAFGLRADDKRSQPCKVLGREHPRKREQPLQMPQSGSELSVCEGEHHSCWNQTPTGPTPEGLVGNITKEFGFGSKSCGKASESFQQGSDMI